MRMEVGGRVRKRLLAVWTMRLTEIQDDAGYAVDVEWRWSGRNHVDTP
jgi:hypothetical protein